MGGGEFRPLIVGRQVPAEGEDPALAKARSLLTSVLDNSSTSPLAKSLNLHTEKDLKDLNAMI